MRANKKLIFIFYIILRFIRFYAKIRREFWRFLHSLLLRLSEFFLS